MATPLAKEPTSSSQCGTFTGVIADLCWAGDCESVCSANLVCFSIGEEPPDCGILQHKILGCPSCLSALAVFLVMPRHVWSCLNNLRDKSHASQLATLAESS